MTSQITFHVDELPSEEDIQRLIQTFTDNLKRRYGLIPDTDDAESPEYFGATTTEDEDSGEPEEEEDLTSAQLVSEAVRVLKLAEDFYFEPDASAVLAGIADRYIALADIVSGHDHYGF